MVSLAVPGDGGRKAVDVSHPNIVTARQPIRTVKNKRMRLTTEHKFYTRSTCLCLLAQISRDGIVRPVLRFVLGIPETLRRVLGIGIPPVGDHPVTCGD
jgi:hypothetical protein